MSLQDQEPENSLSKSDEAYRSHGWRVVEKQEEVIACLQTQLNHQRWEAQHREEAQLQKFKCEENRLKQEARDWKKSHKREIEELKKLGAQQLCAQDNKHRKELAGHAKIVKDMLEAKHKDEMKKSREELEEFGQKHREETKQDMEKYRKELEKTRLEIRVSQKNLKSEFWYAYPNDFQRLDEPTEKITAL